MTAPKWYDFTLSSEKMKESGFENAEQIGTMFENLGAERYVVGKEVGEGGYEHYQCRVVFKTEKDMGHLVKLFTGRGRVSPTHVRDFKYCEKEGEFYRSWEKALNKYATMEPYVWQGMAMAAFKEQNDRQIDVIVDEKGGAGKTTLAKMMVARRMASYCPQMKDAKDYMRFAMAKASPGYIFDVPRCDNIRERLGMWSAIEQIKNGYLWDDRYSYREQWIDPPKILVIANEKPPTALMSADRWRIYGIKNMGKIDCLEDYDDTLRIIRHGKRRRRPITREAVPSATA